MIYARRPQVTLIAALMGLAAAAQNAPQQQAGPVIQANVRQVLVPVVVTDQKGHHVTDLKQSDFKVFEDGVPEDILAFRTAVDSSGSEIGKGKNVPTGNNSERVQPFGPASGAPRRTYLICVDSLHSAFPNFNRVREAISKVLKREEGGDSQYALMTLGRELRVVQDYTQDPSAIVVAARSHDFQKAIQDSEAANTAIAVQQFTELMRSYCAACPCQSNGGGSQIPVCSSIKGRIQGFLLSYGDRTYALNENFLARLDGLVRATANRPNSRTIIFVSDGFNRFPGRELYAILQAYAPKDRTFEFNPRDTEPEIEGILKLATRYDVKFYTLDSRGLYSAPFNAGNTFDAGTPLSTPVPMDSRNPPTEITNATETVDHRATIVARENTDVLAQLARDTGGLFFENNNDLSKGIARALADARQYYVLAYVPKNEILDGKYRRITVELSGNKKFRVNAKAGYWATAK